MRKKFPSFIQLDKQDCGPTCLKIICAYYGKNFSHNFLRNKANKIKAGTTLLDLSYTAESIGFKTLSAQLSYQQLAEKAPLPFIAHVDQHHFIVVYKITKQKVYVSDPAIGKINYSIDEFKKKWLSTKRHELSVGTVLFLEPTKEFVNSDFNKSETDKSKLTFFLNYLYVYKKYIAQLIIGLFLGSLFQLILPLFTQAIVDVGIRSKDISFRG
jgi:ATP-binding cassette subfamily B protein